MQILPALNSGGVERGVIDVSKAVVDAGFESVVVSNGGTMLRQFNSSKVTHIQLPLASKNPFTVYFNIKRLGKIIQKHQVSLVHIRSRSPAWSAYFACKKAANDSDIPFFDQLFVEVPQGRRGQLVRSTQTVFWIAVNERRIEHCNIRDKFGQ